MPRQRSLKFDAKPEPAPLLSTLIILREDIPDDLTAAQKEALRRHLDPSSPQGHAVFFFDDCAEVRRVLRIGGRQ